MSKIFSPLAGTLLQNPRKKRRDDLGDIPGVSCTKDRRLRKTTALNTTVERRPRNFGARILTGGGQDCGSIGVTCSEKVKKIEQKLG